MRYKDTDGTPITVYQPNERQGGLIWGTKQAFSDIYTSRHVIIRLFLRDFVSQFRQKLLGYLWAFITPLLGIFSFLFMYFTGILQPGEGDRPYTLYVLIGTSIWGYLPGAMGAVSGGLQAQADLIMRTRIPKIALAVSSLANLTYSIIINMITTFIIFCLYGVMPTWFFLIYPLLILPVILLGMSLGLVLSVLSSIARDLTSLFTHALGLLIYITPVVYLRDTMTQPIIKLLVTYNPLTYLVEIPRSLVFYGTSENLSLYFIFIGIILMVLVICIRIFYLLEDLVAERL